MTWILTRSGKHFDYADPQPDMIDISDIAHGLATESRFSGQTKVPYYVADHCCRASFIVPPEFAFEALMHDATEAYVKDLSQPLKAMLPEYKAIEKRIDAVIRDKFGLPSVGSSAVKHADLVMLATEKRDLLPPDNTPWYLLEGIDPLPEIIVPRSVSRALLAFTFRFGVLYGEQRG